MHIDPITRRRYSVNPTTGESEWLDDLGLGFTPATGPRRKPGSRSSSRTKLGNAVRKLSSAGALLSSSPSTSNNDASFKKGDI